MRARILARKSNPGNRGGLHYSQFRRYLATRASQIQLLAFRPRRENRRPLSPIREVGLATRLAWFGNRYRCPLVSDLRLVALLRNGGIAKSSAARCAALGVRSK